MIYSLAKELKEAGFPPGGNGSWVFPPEKIIARSSDRVYAPTLSELMEACGGTENTGLWLQQESSPTGIYWGSGRGLDGQQIRGSSGSSPEEAIARLWLALWGSLNARDPMWEPGPHRPGVLI
jgi:hypothetical protein